MLELSNSIRNDTPGTPRLARGADSQACLHPAYILHSGIAGEGETMSNENSGLAGEADSPNENSGLAGEAEEPKHQDRTNFARRMRGHKHVD